MKTYDVTFFAIRNLLSSKYSVEKIKMQAYSYKEAKKLCEACMATLWDKTDCSTIERLNARIDLNGRCLKRYTDLFR